MPRTLSSIDGAGRLRWMGLVIGVVALTSGCTGSEEQALRKRLKRSTELVEQKYMEGHRRVALLASLQKATPDSLKQPTLTIALLMVDEERVSFVLEWIGSSPSADAFGISVDSQSTSIYNFASVYVTENDKSSREFVHYMGVETWEKGTPEFARYKSLGKGTPPVRVFLAIGGQPISEPARVVIQ